MLFKSQCHDLLKVYRKGSSVQLAHDTVIFFFFHNADQSVVDQAINDICILMQCSRHNLNVVVFCTIVFCQFSFGLALGEFWWIKLL